MDITLGPKKTICSQIKVPGDKSISHRFLLLNSIASGRATGRGLLLGLDCLSTVNCLRQLGVEIIIDGATATVTGRGLKGFIAPSGMLDVGNSGTTIRLLPGLLVGQEFSCELTGDDSIRKRPMDRIVKPLRLMDAGIKALTNDRFAPLQITPSGGLHGIDYTMPMASAQVKSCLLLAGLYAEGETNIFEPNASRDHTERMLLSMGAIGARNDGCATICQTERLEPLDMDIPADISSAAYWLVASALMDNTKIELDNIGVNPTRTGIIDALKSMGANIEIMTSGADSPEPTGMVCCATSHLHGIEIGMPLIPRLIDEIPILALAASQAEGRTVIRDAGELRVKEVDRISVLAGELRILGVNITEHDDGFEITGPTIIRGGVVDSHGDHRLAMTFAIASLISEGDITIKNARCAQISYPGFWEQLASCTI